MITILSRCAKTDVKVSDINIAKQYLESLCVEQYSWLSLFYSQPLQVKKWQEQNQLENIQQLHKFATEFKQSHNFKPLVDIINKQPELVRIFTLFLSEQLKLQLLNGMRFESYQIAQQALSEFLQNNTKILGLNLSLAVSRLAYILRSQ